LDPDRVVMLGRKGVLWHRLPLRGADEVSGTVLEVQRVIPAAARLRGGD
jgi:hypothetical protein